MRLKTSRYHNEDPVYYKYRELVVGLFVLIPILLIPVVLTVIVIRSDWARQRFELNFKHTLNVQLNEGNEVYILSKRVGMVRKVKLDPVNGFVLVQLRIDEQYRRLIKSDSKIRVKQKNIFMGDWQVEVDIGGVSMNMVEGGDTLELIPPLDIQKLSDEVLGITATISEVLDTVAHGSGIVTKLLNNDRDLNNRAEQTYDAVRASLKTVDVALAQSNHLLRSTSKLMDSVIAVRTPKVFSQVENLIKRTDSAVIDLNNLISASDSVPADIIRSLELANEDLEEAKILLKSAQKFRILRKKVAEVKAEEAPH